jgi:anti-sigma regulatory factor (Ser/Thr protein kinase)
MITFKVDNLKKMNIDLAKFANFLRSEGFSDDDIFASKLVSCELITNVIRHGGDEALFKGVATSHGIGITISAESLKGVDLNGNRPDIFAESGRGLYIVKSFITGDIERGESGEIKVYIKSTTK